MKSFNISSGHQEGTSDRRMVPIIKPQKQYETAVDLAVAQLVRKKWNSYTPLQFSDEIQKIHKILVGFNQGCVSRCMSYISEDSCYNLTQDITLCKTLLDLLAGKQGNATDEHHGHLFVIVAKEHKEKCSNYCSGWSPEFEYHGIAVTNNSWPYEGTWRQVPITILNPWPDPLDPLSNQGSDEYGDCKAYAQYRISKEELTKNREAEFLSKCEATHIRTAHPKDIHAQMLKFSETILTMEREGISAQKIAAFAHQHLVTIHPFLDGNGRTARFLANIILVKHGFAPIDFKNQCKYQETVMESMRQKDITTIFLARCLELKE